MLDIDSLTRNMVFGGCMFFTLVYLFGVGMIIYINDENSIYQLIVLTIIEAGGLLAVKFLAWLFQFPL